MTTAVKRMYANLGEGILAGDINNLQAFEQARVNDFLVALGAQLNMIPAYLASLDSDYSRAFAWGASGQVVPGAALAVTNVQGTMFHHTGAFTGATPKFLMYPVNADFAHSFSTAGLTAGQSRWDICCYKLAEAYADSQTRDFKDALTGYVTESSVYKERATTIDVQWVEGTPAVTGSAVEPATPTGYAKLYAVRVDYGYAGVFGHDQLRDHRYPLGFHTNWIYPNQCILASGWTLDAANNTVVAGGAGNVLYIPYTGPRTARVVEFSMGYKITDGPSENVTLGALQRSGAGTLSFTELEVITDHFTLGGSDRVTTVTLVPGFHATYPVWGGGHQQVYFPTLVTPTGPTQLAMRIVAGGTGDYVHFGEWGYLGP